MGRGSTKFCCIENLSKAYWRVVPGFASTARWIFAGVVARARRTVTEPRLAVAHRQLEPETTDRQSVNKRAGIRLVAQNRELIKKVVGRLNRSQSGWLESVLTVFELQQVKKIMDFFLTLWPSFHESSWDAPICTVFFKSSFPGCYWVLRGFLRVFHLNRCT